MGNTPETNQGGKLISVNGKTSIEGGSEKPDTPSTGDTTTPNGNFETWVDGKPNNWKTASTAGNASVAQSTDAHSGKYSVKGRWFNNSQQASWLQGNEAQSWYL